MKPTKKKDIIFSIIIVSYNNLGVLRNCLDSVIAMNDIGSALEIIVVEQSPNDEIYNYLIKAYPEVITIRTENKGFGAGNNVGVKQSHGKYLLLLNPDTILVEPIARYAVNKFDNNSRVGVFGFKLLDGERRPTDSFQNCIPYGLASKIKYKIYKKLDIFDGNKMYIQGADLFIRRNLYDIVGGFDETFFMYFEETYLCGKIRELGFLIQYDNKKHIIHLEGKCSSQNNKEKYMMQLDSFKKLCNIQGLCFEEIISKEKRFQCVKCFILMFSKKNKTNELRNIALWIEEYLSK